MLKQIVRVILENLHTKDEAIIIFKFEVFKVDKTLTLTRHITY